MGMDFEMPCYSSCLRSAMGMDFEMPVTSMWHNLMMDKPNLVEV